MFFYLKLKYNNKLMSSFIDRLRSKTRSGINASYKIINDFETSSERECAKMDKENEKIYSRLLTQAEKAHHAIRNSGLSMNLEVPIPPKPSNRDRFLIWKKRNVSKKVIEQTEAVLFLESKGYKYNEHYEAYQAVDLANEIKKSSGESIEFKDSSKNFDNVYNKNDRNIFRRRSMYKLKEHEQRIFTDTSSCNHSQGQMQTQPNFSTFAALPETNLHFQNQRLELTNNPISQEQSIVLNQVLPTPNINNLSTGINSSGAPSAPSAPVYNEINNSKGNSLNQNYSQIAKQNRAINSVKPSAPPASNCQVNHQNFKRNTSSPCIGFGDYNIEC
jgi:hypothetical protein